MYFLTSENPYGNSFRYAGTHTLTTSFHITYCTYICTNETIKDVRIFYLVNIHKSFNIILFFVCRRNMSLHIWCDISLPSLLA